MPPPDQVLEAARREPNQRDLKLYREAIVTLREKRFSFREIAEWLGERGIPADHNAVYRVYTKLMTVNEVELEDEITQEQAEENT